MTAAPLKSREFRKERESSWRELDDLIEIVRERGLRALSPADLGRAPLLYRSALSSLSVARSIALDRALVAYLEDLSLRAFLIIYARPMRIWANLRDYLGHVLPRAVRAIGLQFFITLAALVAGVASGFLLVNGDEGWYPVIVPAGLAGGRGPSSTRKELLDVLSSRPKSDVDLLAMANALFSNNTLVALLTFGTGFLGGIPSLVLTFGNGLMLGAFFALHAHRGLLGEFTGWVSIHGVTELGALVLFGAAGLKLGQSVLFPGRETRAAALAAAGPVVGAVAGGGVLMLLVAAVLEGVFRQTIIDTNHRMEIAALTFLLWTAYFAFTARRSTIGLRPVDAPKAPAAFNPTRRHP
jgi:uncharacterized membrane protein SpoIIM required for sporulation